MHKPKIQIGREDMSRSAHTFLPKNKLVAGMGIGAIAMLAMAVPALSQEAPGTDEVFQLTTVYGLTIPGLETCQLVPARSFRLTSAGSIRCSTSTSWLTATTSRSTSLIRRTFSRPHTIPQPGVRRASLATTTPPVPTAC